MWGLSIKCASYAYILFWKFKMSDFITVCHKYMEWISFIFFSFKIGIENERRSNWFCSVLHSTLKISSWQFWSKSQTKITSDSFIPRDPNQVCSLQEFQRAVNLRLLVNLSQKWFLCVCYFFIPRVSFFLFFFFFLSCIFSTTAATVSLHHTEHVFMLRLFK